MTVQNYSNQAKERREELKAISQPLKALVKEGVYDNLNAALIAVVYKSEENKVFKTFEQWKTEGYSIRKGSRAFAVWGKPQPLKNAEPKENGEEKEFFPVCYLFSDAQVIRKNEESKVEEPEGPYKAFREIQVRYSAGPEITQRPVISTSKDAEQFLRPLFADTIEHRECFYILLLSRSNKILGYSLISIGGITGTVVDARIVFQCALLANASAIVLCHNHPSGATRPSQADIDLTKKLKQAGQLLDITVVDHLIITADGYLSFGDEGIL